MANRSFNSAGTMPYTLDTPMYGGSADPFDYLRGMLGKVRGSYAPGHSKGTDAVLGGQHSQGAVSLMQLMDPMAPPPARPYGGVQPGRVVFNPNGLWNRMRYSPGGEFDPWSMYDIGGGY